MNRIAFAVCAILLVTPLGCRHAGRNQIVFHAEAISQLPRAAHGFPLPASCEVPAESPDPVVRLVNDPAPRTPWALSLHDAIEIAVSHSDVARTLSSGEVRVDPNTRYDPEIARERIMAAMAAFDTSFESNFYWNRYHSPPDSFFGPGIAQEDRRDVSTFTAGFSKRWVTGAVTRVFYAPTTGYLFFPNGTSGLNPAHSGSMEVSVRQPLAQGAGLVVNEAPIVVAQLRTDQSAWDFKRTLLALVRSVEEAYWELQAAHVTLKVLDDQLPMIREVVRLEEAAMEAKRAVDADVAKSQAQLDGLLRRQVAAAASVRRNELRLRSLMGVPPDDGRRIEPATPATRAPLVLDPATSVNNMLNYDPLLLRQRAAIQIREVELALARNGLKPRLDVYALYRENGLSDRLDRALNMMFTGAYNDWEFGALFTVPLGRREAHANERAAELQLQREKALLREMVQVSAMQLGDTLQELKSLHQQYEHAESQLKKTERWLRGARIRYENPPPAGEGRNWLLLALDDYLFALRTSAEAATDAGQILARYNAEIARLLEREGTLLVAANIHLETEPCDRARADVLPSIRVDEPEPERLPAVTQPSS